MSQIISCPYCDKTITVPTPLPNQDRGIQTVCEKCHKPITVYPSYSALQMHEDRSVKAVSVEVKSYVEGIYLEVMESPQSRRQELPIPEGRGILGKQNVGSDSDIQILTDDVDLIRNHAEFWLKKDGILMIKDLGSRIGTYVNGEKMSKGDWRRLDPGDVLTLGHTTVIVHLPESDDDEIVY